MKRGIEALAAELAALEHEDFDLGDAHLRLNSLCDEFASVGEVATVAPVMFRFMERMPGADLGSPGPLVHTLEAMGGYEPFLRESVLENPTQLTLWMVNRIANARRSDWESWVAVLNLVAQNPRFAPGICEQARHFLEVQHAA
jgi:hypothetical protein